MALILKGGHVVDPQVGLDEVADIVVEDGVIKQVGNSKTYNLKPKTSEADATSDCETIDCAGKIVVPGLVDAHVHLREPGFEHKEDIESGTRAAVKGGFTCVCAMPNTNPCIDDAAGVEYVKAIAEKKGKCKVAISGACTNERAGELLSDMGDMFAHGVRMFTDDGAGIQKAGIMRLVMDYATQFDCVVSVHAQDDSLVRDGQVNEGKCSTRLGLSPWPAEGEEVEIERDIALCRLTGCPLHIQHITTKRGLELVKRAKAEGLPVTCEVTPHHMFLTEDDIDDTYPTSLKVNPPLRTAEDAKALVEGVKNGDVDIIVTDHAPHAAYEKDREFELAPFGMIGLETSLACVLTNLVNKGEVSYAQLVSLMSVRPREILRLDPVKFEEGYAADVTVFDPEAEWVAGEGPWESRAENSGFAGQTLQGRVTHVLVDGKLVMKDGEIID